MYLFLVEIATNMSIILQKLYVSYWLALELKNNPKLMSAKRTLLTLISEDAS